MEFGISVRKENMLKELFVLFREEPKWFALLLLCVCFIAYYCLFHHPYDPQPNRTLWTINSSWGKRIVFKTRIIQIPQPVFDNLAKNQPGHEFFMGTTKHLVLLQWEPSSCPFSDHTAKRAYYQAYFSQKASTSFDKDSSLKDFYRKHFIEDARRLSCQTGAPVTPACWIWKYCMKGLCIINPQTREAVVDHSQFPFQVRALLNAYKDWTNEPLLKKTNHRN